MARFVFTVLKWAGALAVLGSLLYAGYQINSWVGQKRGEEAKGDKVELPKRAVDGVVKLGAELAESHGIKDEPAMAVVWHERVTAYGRVVPNPQATVEVRSPFAGTLRAEASSAWPATGQWVRSGQVLGRVDIRAGPQERLDIQAKLAEARAKQTGAEDILRLQQERLTRFQKLSAQESVSRKELDDALLAVAEARTQAATASAAVQLLQKAEDTLEKRGDRADTAWSEPLSAAAEGELTELAARPGMAVEAGGLIARLVDFRRPLVRLELPSEVLVSGPPPMKVDLFAVRAATRPLGSTEPADASAPTASATLVGPAGHVDAASQLAGYWYEVQTPANPAAKAETGIQKAGLDWRPGLFVQADVKTAGAKGQQAVSVPQSALLFHLGRTLVYVRIGPGRFERREVRVLGRDGERWILAAGVAAGEPVVSRQAQVLLSEEFKPQGDMDND